MMASRPFSLRQSNAVSMAADKQSSSPLTAMRSA